MAFTKSRAKALSIKLGLDVIIHARGHVDASYIGARAAHVKQLTFLDDILRYNAL